MCALYRQQKRKRKEVDDAYQMTNQMKSLDDSLPCASVYENIIAIKVNSQPIYTEVEVKRHSKKSLSTSSDENLKAIYENVEDYNQSNQNEDDFEVIYAQIHPV